MANYDRRTRKHLFQRSHHDIRQKLAPGRMKQQSVTRLTLLVHMKRYNKSEDGATALHNAASGGHVGCIELLLRNG